MILIVGRDACRRTAKTLTPYLSLFKNTTPVMLGTSQSVVPYKFPLTTDH